MLSTWSWIDRMPGSISSNLKQSSGGRRSKDVDKIQWVKKREELSHLFRNVHVLLLKSSKVVTCNFEGKKYLQRGNQNFNFLKLRPLPLPPPHPRKCRHWVCPFFALDKSADRKTTLLSKWEKNRWEENKKIIYNTRRRKRHTQKYLCACYWSGRG